MAGPVLVRAVSRMVRLDTGATTMSQEIRIVTYNTHKSRGLDGRTRPQRIVKVLKEINADIIGLQEVLSISGGKPEKDQAAYFAQELGYNHCVGQTRTMRGGVYGNVILSRFPIACHTH